MEQVIKKKTTIYLEIRECMTGYSVEMNSMQIRWFELDEKEKAFKFFKLFAAMI